MIDTRWPCYSLDLNTLLSIPIALFYSQTLEGTVEGERIQLLEAIQRCPDMLRIYHQNGRIQVPRNQNRLYGLLEDCVVGVPARGADSSFHPKVWILRYEADDGPVRYRLIVLSRNLTYDRSWDIAANLDGGVSDSPQERNEPLVAFARYLVGYESFAGAEAFIDDLSRVAFSPPKGFSGNFRFHPIGIGNYGNPIQRQTGEGVLCVTPFVHEAAIEALRRNVPAERWLFGRREELRRLKKGTLDGITTFCLSSVIVDGESLSNSEDGDTDHLEQNLHAKLFIYKRKGRGNIWFIGSANATKAAFERNVEFLLELRGSSDAVQFERILDDLLGPERDLNVFEPFTPNEEPLDDEAEKALEQKVRRLEFELLNSLKVIRAELVQSENTRNYDLHLTLQPGAGWDGLDVRLAPFNSDHDPKPLSSQEVTEFCFQNINESNLSRFLHFEILHKKEVQRAFLMKIDIAGMPAGRVSKIIKGIISDQDKFFEYLRFLLADDFDKEGGDDGKGSGKKGEADEAGIWDVSSPIFEQLLITASRRPARLKEIDGIIRQLLEGDDQDDKTIVPQEFLTLWESFRAMLPAVTEASP